MGGHPLSGFHTVSAHLDDVAFETNCSFGLYDRSLAWIGHVKTMLAEYRLYPKYSVLLIYYHATLFSMHSRQSVEWVKAYLFLNVSRSLPWVLDMAQYHEGTIVVFVHCLSTNLVVLVSNNCAIFEGL
jgi:hypothetical protein